MLDVEGAPAYIRGDGSADDVGLGWMTRRTPSRWISMRPAAEFVTVVASPTFGIVRLVSVATRTRSRAGDAFVASGGYRLSDATRGR